MRRSAARWCAWLGSRSNLTPENPQSEVAAIAAPAPRPRAIGRREELIGLERQRLDVVERHVDREVIVNRPVEQGAPCAADDESRRTRKIFERRFAFQMQHETWIRDASRCHQAKLTPFAQPSPAPSVHRVV